MLESKYSAPSFDLYGDSRSDEAPSDWPAPLAAGPIDASVRLPGSKSLTNRELVLAALADGPGLLAAPLVSRDTDAMIRALRALGVGIEETSTTDGVPALRVTPPEELTGSTTVDCDQAGTVMRFVPALAALALGPTAFDAHETARGRPMGPLLRALGQAGADIADDGRGALPFTVHGRGAVTGGAIEIDASASSQFVSALLLAGPRFEDGVDIRHTGERLPSLPHIEMTIEALAARGVSVETPTPGRWVVAPQPIRALDVAIEPDLSNAAPFLVAAVAAGGTVRVPGWPAETTQVGAMLAELLPAFGASTDVVDGALVVTGTGSVDGVDLDLSSAGELAPPLVALAALASGPSVFRGIGHIRQHETDRIAALVAEIRRLGGDADETADGIVVRPAQLTGARWESYSDHRMATAGAIVGLVTPGVTVADIATTAKTIPDFPALWLGMLGR